ncbi:MAG: hypothetical protein ACRYFK_14305 [Janthinobacterium lividum]
MPLPLLCCLIGLAATVIMGVIGALLNRSIGQIDKKLDGNCEAVATLALDFQGYKQLTDYLSGEVREVKQENRTLREAHHAIDKHIAIQKALHPHLPAN